MLLAVLTGCARTGPEAAQPRPQAAQVLPELVITPNAPQDIERAFEEAAALLAREQHLEAALAFERVVSMDPNGLAAGPSLYNAALSRLALGEREVALAQVTEAAERFAAAPIAKLALLKRARLLAYFERWAELVETASRIDRRADLSALERIDALGALGLGLTGVGRDQEAFRVIVQARDLVEDHGLGRSGDPPLELAQLSFALGEVRRRKSEQIRFDPLPVDFAAALEERCTLLLDAQEAYTDTMRSHDAHWSAMAAYRVGQLYKELHQDVLAAPMHTDDRDRQQLFEGALRLRYRVLLEKGIAMMQATLALEDRAGRDNPWVGRAREALTELERARETEQALLAKLPYSEAELRAALEKLRRGERLEDPAGTGLR